MSVDLHIKPLVLIACLLGQAMPGLGKDPAPATNTVRFLDEEIELIRVELNKKPLSPFDWSLPAELDPFGNWGAAVEGMQIALRFEKEEYTVSEPVVGYLKIRNVGTQPASYWQTVPKFFALEVVAINARNETLARQDIPRGPSFREQLRGTLAAAGPIGVRPGRQCTEIINLHEIFDLTTNGEYVVYCRQSVTPPNGKGASWVDDTWVQSGNAIIRIKGGKPVDTATTSVNTNRAKAKTTQNHGSNNTAVTAQQTNAGRLIGPPPRDNSGQSQNGSKAATGDADGGGGGTNTIRNLKYGLLTLSIALFFGVLLWRTRKNVR